MIKFKKILVCTALSFTILTSNVYAENTSVLKTNLYNLKSEYNKLIKSNVKYDENILNLEKQILNIQKELMQYNIAEETAKKIEKATKCMYGKNSEEYLSALLETLNVYSEMQNPIKRKAKIDELGAFALNNPDIERALYEYYNELFNFYSNYENWDSAIDVLNWMANENLTPDRQKKLEYEYANVYIYNDEYKNGLKHLKKYYKIVTKEENIDFNELYKYYEKLSYIKLDKDNAYAKFPNLYSKINKEIENSNSTDEYYKFRNEGSLISSYIQLCEYEKAKAILKELEKTNRFKNDKYAKFEVYDAYMSIYSDEENYEAVKEYLEKYRKEFLKHFPQNGIDYVFVNQKYFHLYKQLQDYKKAEQIQKANMKLLKEKNNLTPALEEIFVKDFIDLKLMQNEIEEAIKYEIKLQDIIEKMCKNDSSRYYDFYRIKATIYSKQNEYDLALKYFKKAIKILEEKQVKFLALANTYQDISYCYANKNDYKNALKYINKSIKTKKKIYGENNVNVYLSKIDKYNIYNMFNKTDLADKVKNEIIQAKEKNKITGKNKNFERTYKDITK